MLFRAAILYLSVIILLRLMGKRQLGELQPSELVVTILISNIASIPMQDLSLPMVAGILPTAMLVFLELLMAQLSLKWPKFRRILSGNPVEIIKNGKIDQKALRNLRYSMDDLMEALRTQGYFDPEEIWYAVVETTGSISLLPKYPYQQLNAQMMNLQGEQEPPPLILICDGSFAPAKEFQNPWSKQRVLTVLNAKNIVKADVFLFLGRKDGSFTILKKEQST